eukprot:CAMPEP_0179921824 /NCGR_PEP_ID=MMETSP0983-20121128/5278_1 /TAXON_ID=483367 /ORGANISM="non described non described, Strain CCMP 2436" /LENGTH=57 /DNA_ID=CAMNT_0021825063 /DNA_START=91 /DNA_END=264 /DNA_ORIENTATION=-
MAAAAVASESCPAELSESSSVSASSSPNPMAGTALMAFLPPNSPPSSCSELTLYSTA